MSRVTVLCAMSNAIIIRADGTRMVHTSLDVPEPLYLEMKRRRISLSRFAIDAMRSEFEIAEAQ